MMKVQSLGTTGVYFFVPEHNFDERGYFFEAYNRKILEEHGLIFDFVQDNTSLSAGVGRPMGHTDVVVDIRRSSATYGQHLSVELSASNGHQLLIPRGFAHGPFVRLALIAWLPGRRINLTVGRHPKPRSCCV
jgi:dTDP-4-dehydrorhamnose 3,5-epimerase